MTWGWLGVAIIAVSLIGMRQSARRMGLDENHRSTRSERDQERAARMFDRRLPWRTLS